MATAAGDFETAAAQAREDLRQIDAPADLLEDLETAGPEAVVAAYWSWRLDRLRAAGPRPPPPTELATLHMALGDSEAALDALEQAHRERWGWILPFLGVHPLYDPLRAEPRFNALVEDIAGG